MFNDIRFKSLTEFAPGSQDFLKKVNSIAFHRMRHITREEVDLVVGNVDLYKGLDYANGDNLFYARGLTRVLTRMGGLERGWLDGALYINAKSQSEFSSNIEELQVRAAEALEEIRPHLPLEDEWIAKVLSEYDAMKEARL